MRLAVIPILPMEAYKLPETFNVNHDLYGLKLEIIKRDGAFFVAIKYNKTLLSMAVQDDVGSYFILRDALNSIIKKSWSNGRDLQKLKRLFTKDTRSLKDKFVVLVYDDKLFLDSEDLDEFLKEDGQLGVNHLLEDVYGEDVKELTLPLYRVFAYALFNNLSIIAKT